MALDRGARTAWEQSRVLDRGDEEDLEFEEAAEMGQKLRG